MTFIVMLLTFVFSDFFGYFNYKYASALFPTLPTVEGRDEYYLLLGDTGIAAKFDKRHHSRFQGFILCPQKAKNGVASTALYGKWSCTAIYPFNENKFNMSSFSAAKPYTFSFSPVYTDQGNAPFPNLYLYTIKPFLPGTYLISLEFMQTEDRLAFLKADVVDPGILRQHIIIFAGHMVGWRANRHSPLGCSFYCKRIEGK